MLIRNIVHLFIALAVCPQATVYGGLMKELQRKFMLIRQSVPLHVKEDNFDHDVSLYTNSSRTLAWGDNEEENPAVLPVRSGGHGFCRRSAVVRSRSCSRSRASTMDGPSCAVALVLLVCVLQGSADHYVPEATLEFLNPSGLKISLPDFNPAVKQVAYHINVNEEFYGVEHGQYAMDITRKRDGRWTWKIPQIRVKKGDVIYYWINVIEEFQGYNALNREYPVTDDDPHGSGGSGGDKGGSPVTTTTTTTTTTTRRPTCDRSSTLYNGASSYCRREVLMDHRFDSLGDWRHQVSIGGDSPEDEFMVFMKESFTGWLQGGNLFIKPSLLEDKYNDSFVRSGDLLLEGCTSVVPKQCNRRAFSYLILPPIISARVTTKDRISFRYGTVEIRAKLPQGQWIVPELWLEPVNGPPSERVVMGMARGNKDDSEYGWKTLEAGVIGETDIQTSLGKRTRNTPWSQDFHDFKLVWRPGQMTFFVDNQEIHEVRSSGYPIVNKEVYISLGIHVAGNRDFPDGLPGKPWGNSDPKKFLKFWDAKNSWYLSWGQDSSLEVEYVKVTAV